MNNSQDKINQSSAINDLKNVLDVLKTTHKDIDNFTFYYNEINDINKDKNTEPAPIFGVIENDGIKSTYQAFVAHSKTKNKVVILGGGAEIRARIDEKDGATRWVVVAYNTMKNITKETTLTSLSYSEFSTFLESIHLVNLMSEMDFKHYKQHLHAKKPIDVIRMIDFVGYDKVSKCYIYPSFYIDQNGQFHETKQKGYHAKIGVMIQNSDSLTLTTPELSESPKSLIFNTFSLYGIRGITPLCYFIASKFRHLFIDNQAFNYFPFFSFYGTAQSGKSALMRALNGLNFQDGEGIQANASDTAKGIQRQLSQYSGQATVIAELQKGAKFSVDSLLVAYNGGGLYTRANKDNSNTTSSVELNCGLVVAVNHELATTKQAKERFISVRYDLQTRESLGEIKDAEALKIDKDFLRDCRSYNNATQPRKTAKIGRWILENRLTFEAELLTKSTACYTELICKLERDGLAFDDRAVKHLALCLATFYIVVSLLKNELTADESDGIDDIQNALIKDITRLISARVQTATHDTQALDLFVQKLIDYVEREGYIQDKKSRIYKEGGILYFSKSKAYDALDARNNTIMHDRIDKELQLAEYVRDVNRGVKVGGDNQRMVLIDIQKFTMR